MSISGKRNLLWGMLAVSLLTACQDKTGTGEILRGPSKTVEHAAPLQEPRESAVLSKATPSVRAPINLPEEVGQTVLLIQRGGPFPYRKDGVTFQNRERRLPPRPRDYYREFTVPTPGEGDRGARRVITGGLPPEVYYYTPDHYRNFYPLEVKP